MARPKTIQKRILEIFEVVPSALHDVRELAAREELSGYSATQVAHAITGLCQAGEIECVEGRRRPNAREGFETLLYLFPVQCYRLSMRMRVSLTAAKDLGIAPTRLGHLPFVLTESAHNQIRLQSALAGARRAGRVKRRLKKLYGEASPQIVFQQLELCFDSEPVYSPFYAAMHSPSHAA